MLIRRHREKPFFHTFVKLKTSDTENKTHLAKESDVEKRCVRIDKLKSKQFDNESVFVGRLCTMIF